MKPMHIRILRTTIHVQMLYKGPKIPCTQKVERLLTFITIINCYTTILYKTFITKCLSIFSPLTIGPSLSEMFHDFLIQKFTHFGRGACNYESSAFCCLILTWLRYVEISKPRT